MFEYHQYTSDLHILFDKMISTGNTKECYGAIPNLRYTQRSQRQCRGCMSCSNGQCSGDELVAIDGISLKCKRNVVDSPLTALAIHLPETNACFLIHFPIVLLTTRLAKDALSIRENILWCAPTYLDRATARAAQLASTLTQGKNMV